MNKLPPRCIDKCPLDLQNPDFQGIALTRNCKGPAREGFTGSRVVVNIKDGEVVGVRPPTDDEPYERACTNMGFVAWVQTVQENFPERFSTSSPGEQQL